MVALGLMLPAVDTLAVAEDAMLNGPSNQYLEMGR